MTENYDVIIIGSGPGGYVAAIRSAQLGLKTAIVEREHLGGICLNWGCLPTKALLRSAEMLDHIQHAKSYGLMLKGSVSPDIKSIVERSRGVSARLNAGVEFLMKKNAIDIIWGEAKLISPNEIHVSDSSVRPRKPSHPQPQKVKEKGVYKASHLVLATGARPRILPGIEPDSNLIWTFFEAMIPQNIPNSLLVMGSGAIGMEFASFYNHMGSDVSVIEILPRILPGEDAEISMFVRKQMEKRGIKFLSGRQITHIEKSVHTLTATVEGKDSPTQLLTADQLICAAGVQGNTENLGLEALGVKIEKGCIVTDDYGCTNIPGIYAIGDVCGAPMLAHKAEHEGVVCVEKIAGFSKTCFTCTAMPACTYTSPQIASVGLSEDRARQEGREVRIGRFSFSANGKAIALGEDQGIIKTVFDRTTGQLLGAHMAGYEVTELIQGCALAMNLETTEEELMHTIFPHPTLSEMIKESTLDAWGRALNA